MPPTTLKMPQGASQATSKVSLTSEDKNYQFCQGTIEWYMVLEESTFELAKRLKKIRDQEMYLPAWETWGIFLEEMRMKEAKASKLISVYEVWVLEKGFSEKELAPVGWSNLYDAKNFASQAVLDELIHRQDKDARDYILELKSGVPMDQCKHEYYKLEICRRCGDKHQILE